MIAITILLSIHPLNRHNNPLTSVSIIIAFSYVIPKSWRLFIGMVVYLSGSLWASRSFVKDAFYVEWPDSLGLRKSPLLRAKARPMAHIHNQCKNWIFELDPLLISDNIPQCPCCLAISAGQPRFDFSEMWYNRPVFSNPVSNSKYWRRFILIFHLKAF